jgi:hypothetical protein
VVLGISLADAIPCVDPNPAFFCARNQTGAISAYRNYLMQRFRRPQRRAQVLGQLALALFASTTSINYVRQKLYGIDEPTVLKYAVILFFSLHVAQI